MAHGDPTILARALHAAGISKRAWPTARNRQEPVAEDSEGRQGLSNRQAQADTAKKGPHKCENVAAKRKSGQIFTTCASSQSLPLFFWMDRFRSFKPGTKCCTTK